MRTGPIAGAIVAILMTLGCSVPNLESPACSQAQDAVKQFYSFHFGNDSGEAADASSRRRFLTDQMYTSIEHSQQPVDPLTTFAEPPTTFKVGTCEERGPAAADIEVQLYWRNDNQTLQREIKVGAVKDGDRWLINKVSK